MRFLMGAWTGLVMVTGVALTGQSATAQNMGFPNNPAPAPSMANGANSAGTATFQQQAPTGMQVYGSPAMNPYLNPYAATYMGTSPNVALYFYAANQANGGIGSGLMSGTRSVPAQPGGLASPGQAVGPLSPSGTSRMRNTPFTGRGTTARPSANRPAAEMPLAAASPGASAAPFFNRGPNATTGAARYYNRNQTQFQNNGR